MEDNRRPDTLSMLDRLPVEAEGVWSLIPRHVEAHDSPPEEPVSKTPNIESPSSAGNRKQSLRG